MSATDSLQQHEARYVAESAGHNRLDVLHRYLLACELGRDKTVLTIACGDGEGTDRLAAVATSVIGVDSSPDTVARAARRYRRANLTFRGGSCTAIPIMDASIELVVSLDTFEDETHQARMLTEIRRVLAPGGRLLLSTPAHDERGAALKALLRTYFPFVAIAGQRMRAGSVIGPLDDETDGQCWTFRLAEGRVNPPLHLIALASDAPIASVPIGLLDGGDFVFADHPLPVPLERPLDETADALMRRVADLAQSHARDRRRLTEIREVVAHLEAAIDRHREEAQSAWEQVRVHETHIAALEQRHRVEIEERRAAMQTIAVMERSRSWRFTRPLRDLQRRLSRMRRR